MASKMSAKWYTPQLSREMVSLLYHQAKKQNVAMTVLLNRIVQQALRSSETTAAPNLGEGNREHRSSN